MSEQESAAAAEWQQISMQRQSEMWQRGQDWLKKYGATRVAGDVLECLIRIQPTPSLTKRATTWLRRFPDDQYAPRLLAGIYSTDLPPDLATLAREFVAEAEAKHFPLARNIPQRGFGIARLIGRMLSDKPSKSLVRQVERLVEMYPQAELWPIYVFPIKTHRSPNQPAEKLTARWIRLNVRNSKISLMTAPVITPTEEVIRGTFDWIRNGGKRHRDKPQTLDLVILKSRKHEALFSEVVSYTQKWLSRNDNHYYAGRIHRTLMLATEAPQDSNRGKSWYKSHRKNWSSKFVIVSLLELAYRNVCPADCVFRRTWPLLPAQNGPVVTGA